MMLSIFNEEGHATNLLDENVDFGLRSHDMLYALTNVEKQYGASMITQPEVLNKIGTAFFQKDFMCYRHLCMKF